MVAPRTLIASTALAVNAPTVTHIAPSFAPPPPVDPVQEPPASPNESFAKPEGTKASFDQDPRYMPSQGSKNHHKGQCRPCCSNATPEGCSKGASCNFCHCRHSDEKFLEIAVSSAKAQVRRAMREGTRPSRKELNNKVSVLVVPVEPSGALPLCQPCGLHLGEGAEALQMQLASAPVKAAHDGETFPYVARQHIPAQQMKQADGVQSQTRAPPYIIVAQMQQGAVPQIVDVGGQLPQGAQWQAMQTEELTPQEASLQGMDTKVLTSQDVPRYERHEGHKRMQMKNKTLRHAPVAGYQWTQDMPRCGKWDMEQCQKKSLMEPVVPIDDLIRTFFPICASQSAEQLIQTLRQATPAYYDE